MVYACLGCCQGRRRIKQSSTAVSLPGMHPDCSRIRGDTLAAALSVIRAAVRSSELYDDSTVLPSHKDPDKDNNGCSIALPSCTFAEDRRRAPSKQLRCHRKESHRTCAPACSIDQWRSRSAVEGPGRAAGRPAAASPSRGAASTRASLAALRLPVRLPRAVLRTSLSPADGRTCDEESMRGFIPSRAGRPDPDE